MITAAEAVPEAVGPTLVNTPLVVPIAMRHVVRPCASTPMLSAVSGKSVETSGTNRETTAASVARSVSLLLRAGSQAKSVGISLDEAQSALRATKGGRMETRMVVRLVHSTKKNEREIEEREAKS